MGPKVCATCGISKPRDDFPTTGKYVRKDGSEFLAGKPHCKQCFNRIAMNAYYQRFVDAGIEFKCIKCGYDRCVASMDFHHLDPSKKDFAIASKVTISLKTLLQELDKCVVLCRNCHGELHAGMFTI